MARNTTLKCHSLLFVLCCAVLCGPSVGIACAQTPASRPASKGLYDPLRDAAKDIANALADAKRTNRNVLIDVGGEWCSWCHIMDQYFDDHPDLAALRDKNFVFVRVNYSPENENTAVLSRLGSIEGYPHFFVLDANGKVLVNQRTDVLESGRSYDLARFTQFLNAWAPKRDSRRTPPV